jgi:hypothetical protein
MNSFDPTYLQSSVEYKTGQLHRQAQLARLSNLAVAPRPVGLIRHALGNWLVSLGYQLIGEKVAVSARSL